MQFGRCDILNLLAEVPVIADEGWRWEISKVPRPEKFSPIKRRRSNWNVFTHFILMTATEWTQAAPWLEREVLRQGERALVEEAKRGRSNLALDLNYVCDVEKVTCPLWVSIFPLEMEVLWKGRWKLWKQIDLGWNLASATCKLQDFLLHPSVLMFPHLQNDDNNNVLYLWAVLNYLREGLSTCLRTRKGPQEKWVR